nr:hypothetical protein [Tanacetum cinerariifolium]
NRPAFYNNDEDDDEEFSIPMSEIYKSSLTAITPDLLITDSLIMEDEHLDTILETESGKLIKYSVENLVHNPSESEDLSDTESECDVPVCDDFTTFSSSLFDADDIFSSSDDESFSDEDEFFGELAHINLIPSGINEAHFDPEEDIRRVEKLLCDNSSPRPPEEHNSENSDAVIESFSPSPIPVEGSDSLIEEIDNFLTPDDSIPPGIENDDYDSERDILFLEELLSNDSPSLPENESFHFDVPSSPRPPAKPPDVGIYFEPNTRLLTAKVVDISECYVFIPRIFPTQPTLCLVIDTLLLFSSENKDKVHLLFHRGFKDFQLIFDSPMMIYEGNVPTLEVLISLNFEDSRARGFVLRSLDLDILSFIMGIQYSNLID